MALQLTTNLTVVNRDVVFQNAYCTVASITGSKSRMIANVEFRIAQGDELISMRGYEFVHDCESPDGVFRQAYLHLKTLPEFSTATDC
jgi:hypothetical protein